MFQEPKEELQVSTSGSEDDITSVSVMGSDDEHDLGSPVDQFQPLMQSKSKFRKEDSKKRKGSKFKDKR